jgi:hypothetical protein
MNRKLETNTAAFETYSSGRMNWLMICVKRDAHTKARGSAGAEIEGELANGAAAVGPFWARGITRLGHRTSPIFPMANYELGRRFNGSGGHFSAAARSDTG